MDVDAVLEACKEILVAQYGSQFRGLHLYGSIAKGDADRSSDIDMLVLLTEPFDYFDELRRIVGLLYPVQLKSERLISAKPASEDEFISGANRLYRAAKREGIAA